jgi:hypothetical protein
VRTDVVVAFAGAVPSLARYCEDCIGHRISCRLLQIAGDTRDAGSSQAHGQELLGQQKVGRQSHAFGVGIWPAGAVYGVAGGRLLDLGKKESLVFGEQPAEDLQLVGERANPVGLIADALAGNLVTT